MPIWQRMPSPQPKPTSCNAALRSSSRARALLCRRLCQALVKRAQRLPCRGDPRGAGGCDGCRIGQRTPSELQVARKALA